MCGWIYKTPRFTREEYRRLYGAASADSHDVCALDLAAQRSERILQWIRQVTRDFNKVLDVGGGRGELMSAFVRQECDVTVVDSSPAPPISHRVQKVSSDFLDFKPGALYDVVVMSHVLEHVHEPLAFLQHASQLLSPGGVIFVEVPSELRTVLVRRHIGDHRHLGYFSTVTLRTCLGLAGINVHQCKRLTDTVGGVIPLLRAVGRKAVHATPVYVHSSLRALWGVAADVSDPRLWWAVGRNVVMNRAKSFGLR